MSSTLPTADGPLPRALLGLTIVTGLVDAVSYLGLGHVFVANMTGNIVFLGLSAGGATGISAVLSLVAIAAFMLGALAASRLGPATRGDRGRLLALSSGIQAAVVACALVVSLGSSGGRDAVAVLALVLLLAFAMGLQTAAARQLGVADLTTTVLTMTLTSLATDWHHPNTGRRLAAVAAMFVGALAGAALLLHAGMSAALALAMALLFATTVAGYRWSSSTAAPIAGK